MLRNEENMATKKTKYLVLTITAVAKFDVTSDGLTDVHAWRDQIMEFGEIQNEDVGWVEE